MKKINLITVLALVLMFSISAFSKDKVTKPEWVNGEIPEKYRSPSMITVVGEGTTKTAAITDGKNDISGVFMSEVKTISKTYKSSSMRESTTGAAAGEDNTTSNSDTEIKTNVELRGVEIISTYYDSENKKYFALVSLNKNKAKANYLLTLTKLKTEIDTAYAAFIRNPSKQRVSAIKDLMEKFDSQNKEYMVVNSGAPFASPIDSEKQNKMNEEIEKLSSKNTAFLEYEDNFDDAIKSKVESCMTENKVKVVTDLAQAKYKIKIKFKEENEKINVEGWVKFKYRLDADILNKETNVTKKVYAEKSEPGRTKDQSFDKAKDALSLYLCEKIDVTLN